MESDLLNPQSPTDPRMKRPFGRRQAILVAVLAAVLALGLAGGWLLSGLFTSPAQHDAHATAPPAGPVVAQVEQGDLADTVSFNVTIGRQNHQAVPISAGQGLSVVTRQPVAAGAQVSAGEVVLEVNGRPLFAMPGSFPFYRTMSTGDQGPDVLQLQQGLAAAGYAVTADGRFGSSTVSAVRALYKHAGYSAATSASLSPDGQPTAILSVPPAEMAVAAALPAYLTSTLGVSSTIGDDASLTFEQGKLVGVGSVPVGVAARLKPDLATVIRASSGDVSSTLSSVGAVDAKSGEAAVVVAPTQDELSDKQVGETMVAVVTISLAAKDSLIVPSIAVSPQGGGDPIVLKQTASGFVEVKVREVAQLSGQSAVQPVKPGELSKGDFVRVN